MFSAQRFSCSLPKEAIHQSVSTIPILGKTLAEMQDWAVRLNGATWSDTPQAQLWIREDVYISHQAITAFVAAARQVGKDVSWRAEGMAGNFVEEIAFVDPTPMMVWLNEEGELSLDRLTKIEVLEVDVKTYPIAIPAPKDVVGADFIELPLADAVVIPAGHWSQTLWANLLALGPYLWRELVGDNAFKMVLRLGWALLTSMSKDPSKLIRKFNRKGEGCKIHPSAVVEGCVLGDYVTIGANAVVRASVLRDGARVEELAIVEGSVLSERAIVQRQAMVKYSVLGPDASVAGVSQLGVLGAAASVKRGAYLMDMNFGGPVQVRKDDENLNAPLGMIGCGVAENTVIGLGVAVAAGRWVPPNLRVVMHPDRMLRRTEVVMTELDSSSSGDEKPRLMWVDQGGLKTSSIHRPKEQ